MTKSPHLTAKQLELLRVITAGNDEGQPCDLDQILDGIRYCTTKASLHFSLRVLTDRGLVEKLGIEPRRGAKRRLIGPTQAGRAAGAGPTRSAPRERDNIVELGGDDLSVTLDDVLDSIAPDTL